MNRSIKRAAFKGCIPVAAVVLLTTANALAQDTTVGVGATTTVPPRQGAPVVVAPVPGTIAANEHEMWVGHLGVGWLGTKTVPVGPNPAEAIATPVVGVRYWLTSMIGIDGGLGFYTRSQTNTAGAATGETSADGPSRTTFLIHAGLPLALADAGHFSFQITPELDVGFSGGSNPGPMGVNADLSGFLLQLGARAGAEVHFGFIGIPQLALEGSVGVFLASTSGKSTTGATSQKQSNMTIATSSITQPWDIFRSNIAARYYF